MSETKKYYRNFVTMLSGNALSQLIPFLIAPILLRLIDEIEFGIFSNLMAIATMVGIVAAGRLEYAIPVSRSKENAQEIAFTGIILTIGLTLLSVLFPMFSGFFSDLYNSPELGDYLIYVPIAVLSFGLLGLANNWMLRSKSYSIISVGKVSQSLSNNGIAAILGYLGWGVTGLIIGWIIGQFINIGILASFMNRKVQFNNYNITTIKTTIKEYRDFPLINSLHAFTDIFATQFALFWIITVSYGKMELGLFAMMNKYVRAPIILITSSVASLFYAETAAAINNGQNPVPILKKTLFTSLLFAIPFFTVLFIWAPQLFAWYFGNDWKEAGEYTRLISPILFFLFIISPISSIPILFNEQKKAYFFAILNYGATLGAFVIATKLNWNFKDALLLYSSVYAAVHLVILYWYFTLIRKQYAGNR